MEQKVSPIIHNSTSIEWNVSQAADSCELSPIFEESYPATANDFDNNEELQYISASLIDIVDVNKDMADSADSDDSLDQDLAGSELDKNDTGSDVSSSYLASLLPSRKQRWLSPVAPQKKHGHTQSNQKCKCSSQS
jgi:hypothetical protein